MIFRLEMVTVPVSDVDRSKAFYVDRIGCPALVADRLSTQLPEMRNFNWTTRGV